MGIYTEEVINSLKKYTELEEKIKEIKNPEALKENPDYRNLINLEAELKKYTLDGEEIIKIYRDVKNIAKQEYNRKEEYNIREREEYILKINDLEEKVSNLENSKNNLRELIQDHNNFFNGKIVEEIKKDI